MYKTIWLTISQLSLTSAKMHLNPGHAPDKSPERTLDSNFPQINKTLSIFEDISVANDYQCKKVEKGSTNEKKLPSSITKFFIGGVPPCMDKETLADLFLKAKENSNLAPCR